MKRVQFEHSSIPYLFIAPQIVIIAVFFLWPAGQAVHQSFLLEDNLDSAFTGDDGQGINFYLRTQNRELFHRGGTVDVQ